MTPGLGYLKELQAELDKAEIGYRISIADYKPPRTRRGIVGYARRADGGASVRLLAEFKKPIIQPPAHLKFPLVGVAFSITSYEGYDFSEASATLDVDFGARSMELDIGDLNMAGRQEESEKLKAKIRSIAKTGNYRFEYDS